MSRWPQLSPSEQQEKLDQITAQVVPTLPDGWRRLVVRVQTIGKHSEMSAGVLMPDRSTRGWVIPPEVWRLFMQLRKGMYSEGAGSWVGFEYIVDPPGTFTVSYNRDTEPSFEDAPTAEDFALENRWFPRSEDTMPDWFRLGLKNAE
ncbi:hypothetical protein LUW76_29900 [Actinomadura madurae]|uniref:hypothetical protein n=1 Tax=Actinomadura madurae TaxID=1993 RepID=UPI002026820E|nr:hypothetical protein [Actinomadura madurae]URM98235.1 hypothetical protein LUW76_29900 [Actinomadura madurae]URN08926.1 hypothetical protein LUW74_39915 [Actinomadura madurae]